MSNIPPPDGLPSSFDENAEYQATPLQKFAKKLIKEPLIPIGCTLTVAAFISATRAIRKGDHHQAQRMFRARVLAQGFTILAIVGGGIYLADDRKKERQQWALERQQKQQAETQKWIRELEARDAEEKALQERIARRRELRKAGGGGGSGSGPSAKEDEAAEAELEAQLAVAEAREAAAAARVAGHAAGGGVLAALAGMFGGGSGKKTETTPSSTEAAAAAAAAASEPTATNAEAETEKEKPEPRKGARKSHGRSQLDTLGDLFSKRGGGGADGEEKK
ncbi:Respiratory supercomplex factor 1, mitochondrial [Sporothrix curviconia]|uniref:Respiratory supercomplex factor 1, mitochondrial n=1 Tax=Sporothrix curviconia TaxID=1260050 RepID=A0ABP0D0B6_9PEZI